MFDALFHSTILVAIAETGDKTQLLSIILAARFRKFWPLFWGILIATLFNHALAAFLGSFIAGFAASFWVNWIAAIAFIAIGLWILIPDDEPDEDQEPKYGAFITTLIAFFMAEMGDKTQLATITSVSYTHLDVYKRQHLTWKRLIIAFNNTVTLIFRDMRGN